MRISSKRQIAIPKNIMETLQLKPGDEIEFRVEKDTAYIVPITTIRIPREQTWFWTKEWQEKEREVDDDLASGNYRDFETIDAFLKDLHGNH